MLVTLTQGSAKEIGVFFGEWESAAGGAGEGGVGDPLVIGRKTGVSTGTRPQAPEDVMNKKVLTEDSESQYLT